MSRIIFADNLEVLGTLPERHVDLIYIDPPFNTGKARRHTRLRTRGVPDGDPAARGDRTGFQGRRYETTVVGTRSYGDRFDDYMAFLGPRLIEAHRVLAPHGSLYCHVDYRESHHCRIFLDRLFGPENFLNEIIWAYDFGGRPRTRWPAKHDNILFYVKNRSDYVFNIDEIERISYMAPGLVGPAKAARGKLPTDTWWHTIVPTHGSERTGYPTQKPLGILRRVVTASSNPGDLVLDFFAGSGTTGMAAHELGRDFILVDDNPDALEVMAKRFRGIPDLKWEGFDPREWQEKTLQGQLFGSVVQ